jgi:hypothetical protein
MSASISWLSRVVADRLSNAIRCLWRHPHWMHSHAAFHVALSKCMHALSCPDLLNIEHRKQGMLMSRCGRLGELRVLQGGRASGGLAADWPLSLHRTSEELVTCA